LLPRSLPIIVALLAVLCPVAAAEVPAGPHIAVVELIENKDPKDLRDGPPPSVGLAVFDPSTGGEGTLLSGRMDARGRVVPIPFGAPTWSADGGTIAFAGHDGVARRDRIYVISADGTGLRPVPGTDKGAHPVLSPDGRTLAFARTRARFQIDPDFFKNPTKGDPLRSYMSTTTWVVDLAGGKPRRLTRWHNGLSHVATSFSPDGSAVLLTKEDDSGKGPRVMRISLVDGSTRELLRRAKEAVYSPDGSRIAFTGYLHPDLVEAEENHDYLAEELYVALADGTGVKRLSRTENVLESSPSWDPSGQRIAYVRFRADTSFVPGLGLLFPLGNSLMQVNADGTCAKRISSRSRVALYGVAWQPGSGREAGPLGC